MLKRLLSAVVVGAVAKVLLDKLAASEKDADLWAEATDTVEPGH